MRCTPIEYSYHDGRFWMFSEGGEKFIGLEKNENVCLAIYDKYDGETTSKAYSRIDVLFSEFKKNWYSSRQALEYQAKEG